MRVQIAFCLFLLVCGSTSKFLHEQQYADPTCNCPEGFPYWNGEKCVQCESFQFWDEGMKACRSCPETFVYDWKNHECVCPPETPHVQDEKCIACENELVWNEESKQCEACPPETPLYQDGECIECPQDSHYD